MPKYRNVFYFRPNNKKAVKGRKVCIRCDFGYLALTQNGLNLYYCEYCKQNYFYDEEICEYKLLKPYTPKRRSFSTKLKKCIKSKLGLL